MKVEFGCFQHEGVNRDFIVAGFRNESFSPVQNIRGFTRVLCQILMNYLRLYLEIFSLNNAFVAEATRLRRYQNMIKITDFLDRRCFRGRGYLLNAFKSLVIYHIHSVCPLRTLIKFVSPRLWVRLEGDDVEHSFSLKPGATHCVKCSHNLSNI